LLLEINNKKNNGFLVGGISVGWWNKIGKFFLYATAQNTILIDPGMGMNHVAGRDED
jgi:hypothetical protein